MKVIKRDGRKVEFDENKIKDAIEKAYKEVYPDEDNEVIVLAIADVIELILQYQKVNEGVPIEKKVFSVRVLRQQLNAKKQENLKNIEDINFKLLPQNYIDNNF